jgi:5-methylcytosine-specific restriction enzyme subunit McrC
MVRLFEQFGYKAKKEYLDNISMYKDRLDKGRLINCNFRKVIKNNDCFCYNIEYIKKDDNYHFKTSYFVGIDWIIENSLSIYVQPKQNNETTEIDYLRMLFEALEEPENFEHLEGLCEIYFDKPTILIEQKEENLLSPFLIVQFLQILRRIVQKGLKKSYYPVTRNLEAQVKGKILVNQTIKENVIKSRLTKTICQYNEFGYNCEENKILKKAFLFSRRAIQQYNLTIEKAAIKQIISYINPVFVDISDDIQTDKIKAFKPNPLYKEYHLALKLALLILRRFSYNITQTEEAKEYTPPFWIDMSKLFELYVFKKLKEVFPNNGEVQYHLKASRRELDFLINSNNNEYKMVVEAKYKPQYENYKISKDDIRQVCEYARMEYTYIKLGLTGNENNGENKIIDCLIIYPHQDCDVSFTKASLKAEKQKEYVNFYKLGIRLPVIKKTSY